MKSKTNNFRKSLPIKPIKVSIKSSKTIVRSAALPVKNLKTPPLKKSGSQNFEETAPEKVPKHNKLDLGLFIKDFQLIYHEMKKLLKRVNFTLKF